MCRSVNVRHHIKGLKDRNHMIFSIEAEKGLDKMPHSFMIKALKKVGAEGMCLNITKVVYDEPAADIIQVGENFK